MREKEETLIQATSKETLVYFSRTERKIIAELMYQYAIQESNIAVQNYRDNDPLRERLKELITEYQAEVDNLLKSKVFESTSFGLGKYSVYDNVIKQLNKIIES